MQQACAWVIWPLPSHAPTQPNMRGVVSVDPLTRHCCVSYQAIADIKEHDVLHICFDSDEDEAQAFQIQCASLIHNYRTLHGVNSSQEIDHIMSKHQQPLRRRLTQVYALLRAECSADCVREFDQGH